MGKVFYGNIGSDTRLDFTVVGPAVNEVSRIASLCRSVEQDLIVSPDVVDALAEEERARFVSLGRFALRGVARPQELFTLDRSAELTGRSSAGRARRLLRRWGMNSCVARQDETFWSIAHTASRGPRESPGR